jgi:hypothetical protein
MRRAVIGLAVAVLMVTWKPVPVATAPPREAAADTLASQGKLLCHRSFRATSWSLGSGPGTGGYPPYYYETDQDPSDPLLCGDRWNGNTTLRSTFEPPTVETGINGIPVLSVRGRMGHTFLSISQQAKQLSGRFGWRFYRWMSADLMCEQGKAVQIGLYWTHGGSVNSLISWQAGGTVPKSGVSAMHLKWWRWEIYYQPSYLTPTSVTIFLKNITDNTPETTLTVTNLLGMSGYQQFNDLIHTYRDRDDLGTPPESTCTNRYTHMLVAHNLGPTERIPPAMEVEGGSGGGTTAGSSAPGVPTGLTLR